MTRAIARTTSASDRWRPSNPHAIRADEGAELLEQPRIGHDAHALGAQRDPLARGTQMDEHPNRRAGGIGTRDGLPFPAHVSLPQRR